MKPTFGDGSEAPPILSRELIELHRASSLLADMVRDHLREGLWYKIEADIAPQVARIVVYYAETASIVPDFSRTVELDLHPGMPIDDRGWLAKICDRVVQAIRNNESDLVIPESLDFVRITDEEGQTLFVQGKAVEIMTSPHRIP